MLDTVMCLDMAFNLKLNVVEYDTLIWNNNQSTQEITINHHGTYWAIAENNCGFASDTVNVASEDCRCQVFFPNSFTPNEDNLNDLFSYESNCKPIKRYILEIYNRWGQLIFRSENYKEKWDGTFKGKLCPPDT